MTVAAYVDGQPGRREPGHRSWPDRRFVEPGFVPQDRRPWDGGPREWALLAVRPEPLYAEVAGLYSIWEAALKEGREPPVGPFGRDKYEATCPTEARTWLIGEEIW